MGSFYTNITLRTDRLDDVVEVLHDLERDAYVSQPQKGCLVVFDKECEEQDVDTIKRLASALSSRLKTPALGVLNHDDDILMYVLYDNGKLLDEYNSSPGYFESAPGEEPEGGDASALGRAFGVASTSGVEDVLHAPRASGDNDGYVFEYERHEALVASLHISTFAVGFGFNYLEEGEFPEDASAESFTRV
jgi:hypothetical protein